MLSNLNMSTSVAILLKKSVLCIFVIYNTSQIMFNRDLTKIVYWKMTALEPRTTRNICSHIDHLINLTFTTIMSTTVFLLANILRFHVHAWIKLTIVNLYQCIKLLTCIFFLSFSFVFLFPMQNMLFQTLLFVTCIIKFSNLPIFKMAVFLVDLHY